MFGDGSVLLLLAGVLLCVVTLGSQVRRPAPYGRHDPKDGSWGRGVNQRVAHLLNDGLWGVAAFTIQLHMTGADWSFHTPNSIFITAWLIHFIHRGVIHPMYMRYSSKTIAIGIPLTGLTLAYFSFIHASYLAHAVYQSGYIYDIRFVLGSLVFVTGFIINRWADITLRNLRPTPGEAKYVVPHDGLFRLVSCPNYLGEMIQWLGWAVATWSVQGFLYFCFVTATFVPRSRHNHHWCCLNLKNYPRQRRYLIPYVY